MYSDDSEQCVSQQCCCFKETAFVLSRSNSWIYLDVGHSPTKLSIALAILDTGASLSLVRAEILEAHIRAGLACDIRDAGRRPIRVVGTIRFRTHIGTLLFQVDFLVCDRLAAPYILGTPFLDRTVLSIQPPEGRVQLTYFSYEPIVRHPLLRGLQCASRSQSINAGCDQKVRKDHASIKLQDSRDAALKHGHQTWVQVTAYKAVVHTIEPRGDIIHQHSVSALNLVLDIEPGIRFCILVASFAGKHYRLLKGVIIEQLKSAGYPLPASSMPSSEVLGFD